MYVDFNKNVKYDFQTVIYFREAVEILFCTIQRDYVIFNDLCKPLYLVPIISNRVEQLTDMRISPVSFVNGIGKQYQIVRDQVGIPKIRALGF